MSISDFLLSLRDRMKKPFYWAFVFSWCIVNWRILLLLFSYDTTSCRNGVIECIEGSGYFDALHLVTYPLMGALAYVVFIPFLDLAALWFNVTVLKYLQLKVLYKNSTLYSGAEMQIKDKRIEILEQELSDIVKVKTDLQETKSSLKAAQDELTEKRKWYRDNQTTVDESLFDGEWKMRLRRKETDPLSDYYKFTIRSYNGKLDLILTTKDGDEYWGVVESYSTRNVNEHLLTIRKENLAFGLLILKAENGEMSEFKGHLDSYNYKMSVAYIELVRTRNLN